MAKTIRLYRIFNAKLSKFGEAFGACEKHAKECQDALNRSGHIGYIEEIGISEIGCNNCGYEKTINKKNND